MHVKLTMGEMFNTQSFVYCLKKAIKNSYLITSTKTQVAFKISSKVRYDVVDYDVDGFWFSQGYSWAKPQEAIHTIIENIEIEIKRRTR